MVASKAGTQFNNLHDCLHAMDATRQGQLWDYSLQLLTKPLLVRRDFDGLVPSFVESADLPRSFGQILSERHAASAALCESVAMLSRASCQAFFFQP